MLRQSIAFLFSEGRLNEISSPLKNDQKSRLFLMKFQDPKNRQKVASCQAKILSPRKG